MRGETLKELLNAKYGFKSQIKGKANFIDYVKKLTDERLDSKGNFGNWDSALKHLIKYCGENVAFDYIDQQFCEGFKEYLQNTAKTSSKENLSANSVNSYFCKFRAALGLEQLQQENGTWKIVFHQKKTNGLQYHYINDNARNLLGAQIAEGRTNMIYIIF